MTLGGKGRRVFPLPQRKRLLGALEPTLSISLNVISLRDSALVRQNARSDQQRNLTGRACRHQFRPLGPLKTLHMDPLHVDMLLFIACKAPPSVHLSELGVRASTGFQGFGFQRGFSEGSSEGQAGLTVSRSVPGI